MPAGEILYKAWQNCSEENRDYIEQDIIQEVMNSAILARTTQLHTNLVRMLSCIHEQKDAKEMLQRLYQPILWPALAAPNANVRRNAVSILLSAFPITVRYPQSSHSGSTTIRHLRELQREWVIVSFLGKQ